jgi:hypothetical protein
MLADLRRDSDCGAANIALRFLQARQGGRRPIKGTAIRNFLIPFMASTILTPPVFAQNQGGYHGAPDPIDGAGFPFIAAGFGVYWLIRHRRKIQLSYLRTSPTLPPRPPCWRDCGLNPDAARTGPVSAVDPLRHDALGTHGQTLGAIIHRAKPA